MTAAEFLAFYPEFSTAGTALIDVKIAEAEFRVSDTWGARRDTILALEVAANLADSVQGRNARLDAGKRNVYAERLKAEKAAFAALKNRIG
jgi:hypothetical protein